MTLALASIVGFIGLGVMGSRMAKNLLKAGHRVVVQNRSRGPVQDLVRAGAVGVSSPEELAGKCRIIFLSLPSSESVKDVVLGDKGLMKCISPGSIIIDTSTIDPDVSLNVAREVWRRKCYFLDAPVSGGPEGAKAGTLTIMIGGNRSAFNRCKHLLKVIGKSIFYIGQSGSGEKIKLVNQMLVAIYFGAAAEAYLWARKMGVKERDLQRVIPTAWGDSPVFRHFLSVVMSGHYEDGARMRLLRKDLSLILAIGMARKLKFQLSERVYRLFARASELGYDDLDVSAINLLLSSQTYPS